MTEKPTYTNIHDILQVVERHKSSSSLALTSEEKEKVQAHETQIKEFEKRLSDLPVITPFMMPVNAVAMSPAQSAAIITGMSSDEIQSMHRELEESDIPFNPNASTTIATGVPTDPANLIMGRAYPATTAVSASMFSSEEDRILRNTMQRDIIRLVKEERKRTDESLNRIVCAANRPIVDGVPCEPMILGPRHWDDTMRKTYDLLKDYLDLPPHSQFEQGFVDIHGVFRTRTEAWPIALAAGQIIFRCGGDQVDGGTLYSDNMY